MPDQERLGLKKEILTYITIITSPIGLDKLPMDRLRELHATMRDCVLWIKSFNADELED